MKSHLFLLCAGSVGIGICVSTGHPLGIAAGIAMPTLTTLQLTRRGAYASAFCYYAGALWPLIPAVRSFFGPSACMLEGIVAWLTASILVASPWLFAWTPRPTELAWRSPLALLATVVPPLGLIGWASPLTAAGFIFPGAGWAGLLLFIMYCADAGTLIKQHRLVPICMVVFVSAFAHLTYRGEPKTPPGWEGIDTSFGTIMHGPSEVISEYNAEQAIQKLALSSKASVIVFPEMTVPRWTDATDLFWQPTFVSLAASGKTIIVGAGIPNSSMLGANLHTKLKSLDFAAAITLLKSNGGVGVAQRDQADPELADTYRCAMVVRGAQHNAFIQRIPVPLGMWHPFGTTGVPLNLFGPGTIRIGDQRAGILICYEQLLAWPVLMSMFEHPTVLVAVANDYWVQQTTIPRYQANATRAWARLFSLPVITAVNG